MFGFEPPPRASEQLPFPGGASHPDEGPLRARVLDQEVCTTQLADE